MVEEGVSYGRKFFDDIEFSAEDASRSSIDFLIEVFKVAIKSGATTINVPDTVGYTTPNEFTEIIRKIKAAIPDFDNGIYLSVHCHNDLGLATANTISAIMDGANQVEVTINGIGERAGNTPLEEVVMALVTREDYIHKKTNIKIENIYPTSKLLTRLTGILPSVSKPIVGDNVFVHESGIHQDGVIKNRETYEIIDPKSIGRDIDNLVLGRHSGINGFKTALSRFGIVFNDEEMLKKAYNSFDELADIKKNIFIDDLLVIWGDLIDNSQSVYNFLYHQVTTGNNIIHTATVKLKKGDDVFVKSEHGDGPVDSLFNAIDSIIDIKSTLTEYIVKGISAGKDSQGEVLVSLEINGRHYNGKGISTDTIEASGKAYINAINKYLLLK
jgi:2-isopropylmalate synthase